MNELLGALMFPLAIAGIVLSGAPAFVVLLGVALVFAALGVGLGAFDASLLRALPLRLVGLLEHDLLQALALYALVGALLHRLELAEIWLKCAGRWLAPTRAGAELAAIGLGALTAPMNGSVGASLGMLRHTAAPRLAAAGIAPARATALVAVASTLGVIVPPSLVLLLLGDALMRAHTEALLLAPAAGVRIINNQDVIRAVLLPGALVLAVVLLITALAAWRQRRPVEATLAEAITRQEWGLSIALTLAVPLLLGGVAAGHVFAVEAAALAGGVLLVYGVASGELRGAWAAMLDEAMRLTGLVFGLLIGATTFTLVLRGFGTDAGLTRLLGSLGAGPYLALGIVLGLLLACAFVLDAFELIFLVVPLVMPPLLARVGDPAWVAVLTLLVLQIGFLLPPLGYAVLMARGASTAPAPLRAVAAALAPYLAGLLLVLAAVLAWPGLTHLGRNEAAAAPALSESEVENLLRQRGGRPDAPP